MAARVLIVDDNQAWLSGTAELLSSAGYLVRTASAFPEAKPLLSSFAPDLLIADVRLAGYNGLYLLVRGRTEHAHMASVVVSAFDDPVLAREAKSQGAYDFLVKPIAASVLLANAAAALETRGRRRTTRKAAPSGLVAQVDGQVARLLDVSYDGLRLALPFACPVGRLLEIMIPSFGRTLLANAVWVHTPEVGGMHECGVALKLDDEVAPRWRYMVDHFCVTALGAP